MEYMCNKMLIDGENAEGPYYLKQPFGQEPIAFIHSASAKDGQKMPGDAMNLLQAGMVL